MIYLSQQGGISDRSYNPFVKPGDIVYLKDKKGRYKVIDANADHMEVIKEAAKDHEKAFIASWKEFKRWSFR